MEGESVERVVVEVVGSVVVVTKTVVAHWITVVASVG